MIDLLDEALRIIRALWNLGLRRGRRGMRLARMGIRVVFAVILFWPFVMLAASRTGSPGFVAIVTMVPLAAIFLLIFIYPLASGVLAVFRIGRTFYAGLAIVLFAEMITGLYLTGVPVWSDPGLIPVLILLVVVLGVWLFLRRQFGLRRGRWFTAMLILAIIGVTITFFLGGREEVMRRFGPKVRETVQASYMPFKSGEAQPVIKGETIEVTVPLHSDRWSEPILPAPYSWFFFEGPNSTPVSPDCRIRLASGTGEPQPCGQWLGIKAEYLNGFQFMGPEGREVIVKMVSRQ